MDSQTKWNQKYEERLKAYEQKGPNERLHYVKSYFTGGKALDLACGLGENSFFLAKCGYNVEAIDISDVAVRYVAEKKGILPIRPHLVDLSDWGYFNVNENSFDLVVITYYLDRSIFPLLKSVLKEGGLLFMETFYLSPSQEKKTVSNQYKLKPNELLEFFHDWQVLFYEENEREGRQTIFVRKTTRGTALF